jgi:hypothetical protein
VILDTMKEESSFESGVFEFIEVHCLCMNQD